MARKQRKVVATVENLRYGKDLSNTVKRNVVSDNRIEEKIVEDFICGKLKLETEKLIDAYNKFHEYKKNRMFNVWGWTQYDGAMWIDGVRDLVEEKVEDFFDAHLFSKDGKVIIPIKMVINIEEKKEE